MGSQDATTETITQELQSMHNITSNVQQIVNLTAEVEVEVIVSSTKAEAGVLLSVSKDKVIQQIKAATESVQEVDDISLECLDHCDDDQGHVPDSARSMKDYRAIRLAIMTLSLGGILM